MVESESELVLWTSGAGYELWQLYIVPENQGPVFLCAGAHLMFLKLLSLPLCSLSKVQWGGGEYTGGLGALA